MHRYHEPNQGPSKGVERFDSAVGRWSGKRCAFDPQPDSPARKREDPKPSLFHPWPLESETSSTAARRTAAPETETASSLPPSLGITRARVQVAGSGGSCARENKEGGLGIREAVVEVGTQLGMEFFSCAAPGRDLGRESSERRRRRGDTRQARVGRVRWRLEPTLSCRGPRVE
jgi:hypothetical protein